MTKKEKEEGKKEIEDLIEKLELINKLDDLTQELWDTASYYGDIYNYEIGEGSGKIFDEGKIWRDKDDDEREKALNKIYALEEKGKLERWDLDYLGLTGWTIWL